MLLVTLGDALLDVIVRLGEPLAPGADANATTQTGAGGQAANVAAWAVELGAQARTVAKRGADASGRLVAATRISAPTRVSWLYHERSMH